MMDDNAALMDGSSKTLQAMAHPWAVGRVTGPTTGCTVTERQFSF